MAFALSDSTYVCLPCQYRGILYVYRENDRQWSPLTLLGRSHLADSRVEFRVPQYISLSSSRGWQIRTTWHRIRPKTNWVNLMVIMATLKLLLLITSSLKGGALKNRPTMLKKSENAIRRMGINFASFDSRGWKSLKYLTSAPSCLVGKLSTIVWNNNFHIACLYQILYF